METKIKSKPESQTFNVSGKRFSIVASRWNIEIVEKLVEGAITAFKNCGNPNVELIWVPGAWEIPVAVLREIDKKVDGVVCVGCILQGATVHAQQLSNAVASGLAHLAVTKGVPIGHGVLTCSSIEEAEERAGGKFGNKGEESALAVIEMCS